jgi:serine/threonine protein kinase
VWKIVDFGVTSEATSSRAIPTIHARGTGGYRAPEILNESPVFTNKVDIWALGCIFFELYTGEKAFHDD